MQKILVTGAAGFIGFHLTMKLIELGYIVVGIDNINDYYDVKLKYARLHETGIEEHKICWNREVYSERFPRYKFIRMNLEDKEELITLFKKESFNIVINLAAQAGVRYSIENPEAYIQSNIIGFFNVLEAARYYPVEHLIFASSSSVYGMNSKIPFSVNDKTDSPVSLYAATKKSNELMAYTYSHLYNIPVTGLRFFTVYGPWGRPDMAPMLFASAILQNKSIKVFNNGYLERDFTYIDDVVNGIIRVLAIPESKKITERYRIFNIGNNNPVKLLDFISELEFQIGIEANKEYLPMQDGDVFRTFADISDFEKVTGYKPKTTLRIGVKEFVNWYVTSYNKG